MPRFGRKMLKRNLGVTAQREMEINRWFGMSGTGSPRLLGNYLDHNGKGTTMLSIGAVLMMVSLVSIAVLLTTYASTLVAYGSIMMLGN